MRITRHQMFLEMARVASKRSTCHRLNVGAILVQGNHILSQGYNGPPSGQEHCQGNECRLSNKGACIRAIHAERNAIQRAGLWSHTKEDVVTMYVTHSPCPECAKLLKHSYIDRVVYETAYRDTTPLEYLISVGIEVFKLSPSGYLVNHKTNEIQILD